MKQDTTTQGNWINVYGNQGYDILNDAVSIPSYANVTPAGQTPYTWTTTSSDVRALQTPGSNNRVAAAWYCTTSFTIASISPTAKRTTSRSTRSTGTNCGRSEQIQISNAATARSWIPRPSPISRAGTIFSGRSPGT